MKNLILIILISIGIASCGYRKELSVTIMKPLESYIVHTKITYVPFGPNETVFSDANYVKTNNIDSVVLREYQRMDTIIGEIKRLKQLKNNNE